MSEETSQNPADDVEAIVFQAMKERLESLVIIKTGERKPDAETEAFKTRIIRLDDEIRKLTARLADADDALFDYIRERVGKLHSEKSALEEKLMTKARKHKNIDAAPLVDPMNRWDSLTVREKRALAASMIDVVYVSDETGVEIEFSV